MNNRVKFSLIAVGLVLVGYGVYAMVSPEISVNDEMAIQNNNDTYITIVLGIVAVVLGIVGGKSYK